MVANAKVGPLPCNAFDLPAALAGAIALSLLCWRSGVRASRDVAMIGLQSIDLDKESICDSDAEMCTHIRLRIALFVKHSAYSIVGGLTASGAKQLDHVATRRSLARHETEVRAPADRGMQVDPERTPWSTQDQQRRLSTTVRTANRSIRSSHARSFRPVACSGPFSRTGRLTSQPSRRVSAEFAELAVAAWELLRGEGATGLGRLVFDFTDPACPAVRQRQPVVYDFCRPAGGHGTRQTRGNAGRQFSTLFDLIT
jgi:hypothetical protein